MAGVGGLQRPRNPAAVSGVGENSRRTDGGPAQPIRALPDAAYGEGKQFVDEQRSAPLAAGPTAAMHAPASVPSQGPDPSVLVGLNAPSQMPGQPVTHGADLGAGATSAALNLPSPVQQAQQSAAQFIQQAAAGSNDPMLQFLAGAVQSRF